MSEHQNIIDLFGTVDMEPPSRIRTEDSPAVIDDEFVRNVQAAVEAHREPLDASAWDGPEDDGVRGAFQQAGIKSMTREGTEGDLDQDNK